MTTAFAWVGFAAGIVVLLGTWGSVLETAVVPRGNSSRITAALTRSLLAPITLLADRIDSYERRDRLLAYYSAMFLVAVLAAWLLLFLIGFTLLLWPFTGPSFPEALRLAGSSMFTLGIASARDTAPTGIVFVAAATGLVVIALQIAYLPVLYAAYNRRETLVTMLEGLAGSPAWGPEILARAAIVDNVDSLNALYDRWAEWAADVAESHTAYPVLLYFRSPVPDRSWVLGLLSVLDAAAMQLSLCPVTAPSAARTLMRTGYLAMRQLAGTIGVPAHDPNPDDPLDLPREQFDAAVVRLDAVGMELERTADAAWPHFRGWRVNYEYAAYALADRVDAQPALWSGPRRRPGPVVEPRRPIDRVSASAEVTEIARISELRRRRRAEALAPRLHDHGDDRSD